MQTCIQMLAQLRKQHTGPETIADNSAFLAPYRVDTLLNIFVSKQRMQIVGRKRIKGKTIFHSKSA